MSAVQDLVIKLGSYRRVTYADLDIVVSEVPTLPDVILIVEMGFKKLWVHGLTKSIDPVDYFHDRLTEQSIKF